MIPRQLEGLADERKNELIRTMTTARQPSRPGWRGPARYSPRRGFRRRAGWVLVAIGLRIAESAGS